jgi:hypothetical protein
MAEILSSIGMGVGIGSGMGVISDYLRMGMNWAKWKTLGQTLGKPMMADVMQQILSSEKDSLTGLNTRGIMSSMFNFIDKTMDLQFVLNEQMANALFMHMIQQSVAYAIHQSHGGAVQTICNVYSGSMNMQGLSVGQIADNADLLDSDLKAFISAATGVNIPTLTFEFTKGANTRVEAVYKRVMSQVDSFTDKWNNLIIGYYDHYHTMARTKLQEALEMKENIMAKGYALLEKVANEHLARIAEQIDTITGINNWYKAAFTTVDELVQICLRVDTEVDASIQNYNDYTDEILESIEDACIDWDIKINNALSDIQECEAHYAGMIKDIFSVIFNDVRIYTSYLCDEVDKAVENVCAYRNVTKPTVISTIESLGEFEKPELLSVYRTHYRKWADTDAITLIPETQSPHGMPWSYIIPVADVPIVELAYVLSRNRWIDIGESFISEHTEPTPLVPWYGVGD